MANCCKVYLYYKEKSTVTQYTIPHSSFYIWYKMVKHTELPVSYCSLYFINILLSNNFSRCIWFCVFYIINLFLFISFLKKPQWGLAKRRKYLVSRHLGSRSNNYWRWPWKFSLYFLIFLICIVHSCSIGNLIADLETESTNIGIKCTQFFIEFSVILITFRHRSQINFTFYVFMVCKTIATWTCS